MPERERAPVERRRADVCGGANDPKAVLLQAERPHDRRIERRRMRERRHAKPWCELARARAAARAIAAFEDERLQPGFGKKRRSNQPVMAAANHEDINGHHRPFGRLR